MSELQLTGGRSAALSHFSRKYYRTVGLPGQAFHKFHRMDDAPYSFSLFFHMHVWRPPHFSQDRVGTIIYQNDFRQHHEIYRKPLLMEIAFWLAWEGEPVSYAKVS